MEPEVPNYSGVFIAPSFFTYHSPNLTNPGNSNWICLKCPPRTKSNGLPRTLSNNDTSRLNLCSHIKSQHPGLLDAFKEACEEKVGRASKRKRDDSDCAEIENSNGVAQHPSTPRQPTVRESFKKKRSHCTVKRNLTTTLWSILLMAFCLRATLIHLISES